MIVRLYGSLVAICLVAIVSCTKQEVYPELSILDKSDEKEIVSFSFKTADSTLIDSSSVDVNFQNDTFYLSFPYSTDLSILVPHIEIKGLEISPASGVAQDFTKPVHYTVMAEDSTTKAFVVMAKVKGFRAIYFGSTNKHLYALNPDNGTVIWDHTYSGGGNFAYSDPIIADNTLFAGNTDGNMCAFNPVTGHLKWKYFTDWKGIESPAAAQDGVLYFGSNDGKFTALNAATGDFKWSFQTLGNVSTKGVFYNDVVIFGSSDGGLYAVDTLGSLRWKYTMGDMANQSSPAIHDGVVFIGSRDSYLYAINASDGSMKWRFSDGPYSMEMSSPFVDDGKVYMGSWYDLSDFTKPGSLYAIDEYTGDMVWKTFDSVGIGANPYINNGRLFIAPDDGRFYALNAQTGEAIWSKEILPNGARAVAGSGTVYIGGGGSWNFYAFDEATGIEKWKFPTPNGIGTSNPLLIE